MLKCLLLLVAGIAQAQSFKPFNVGALQCGLVKRAADSVQVYCYGPNKEIYFNSLEKVVPYNKNFNIKPGLIISYGYGTDAFVVYFNLVVSGIYYEIATGATGNPTTGVLVDVFASVGDGCGLPVLTPRFYWTGISKSCISAWLIYNWADCCLYEV